MAKVKADEPEMSVRSRSKKAACCPPARYAHSSRAPFSAAAMAEGRRHRDQPTGGPGPALRHDGSDRGPARRPGASPRRASAVTRAMAVLRSSPGGGAIGERFADAIVVGAAGGGCAGHHQHVLAPRLDRLRLARARPRPASPATSPRGASSAPGDRRRAVAARASRRGRSASGRSRCGASYRTIVRRSPASAARRSDRSRPRRGRKPSITKRCAGRPLRIDRGDGGGRAGHDRRPAWSPSIAARTSRSPGSAMPGVPASVTTATVAPSASRRPTSAAAAASVCSLATISASLGHPGVLQQAAGSAGVLADDRRRPRPVRRRRAATGRPGCRSGWRPGPGGRWSWSCRLRIGCIGGRHSAGARPRPRRGGPSGRTLRPRPRRPSGPSGRACRPGCVGRRTVLSTTPSSSR